MADTYKVSDLCDAATAGDVDQISTILDAQPSLVNVHVAKNNEHLALHFAVLNEQPEAVRLLVERGAKIDQGIYPHRESTGPLTMAQDRGLTDIVEIIRTEEEKLQLAACENITISPENDALFDAVQSGDDAQAIELLDANTELLNACHRNGGSVLYAAACQGRYQLVSDLLKRGADHKHLTPGGASPLDGACHNIRGRNRPMNEGCLIAAGMLMQAGCQASLETAVILGDHDLIRDYHAKDPSRFENDDVKRLGLLHLAVTNSGVATVKLLLELGCHPDDRHQLLEYESKPYSWGQPLWIAAGEGLHEIAEVLLEAGADPNGSVYASGDPVSRAYNNRDDEMKGLLFRYGGVLGSTFAGLEGETAAASVFLQKDPELAENLLWAAGCGGDLNLAGLCLRHLNLEPDDPRWLRILEQPLRLWRLNPHRKHREFDRTVYPKILEAILKHGASPNVVGRYGYRLLHHLAACGVTWNEKIMTEPERITFGKLFLDYGADLDVIDDLLQSTPLGWAVRYGKHDLARLYIERGADVKLAGGDWATPMAWARKGGDSEMIALIEQHAEG